MRTRWGYWSVFLGLGALVWLASVGAFTHPVYRLVVILAVLSWGGYVVWTPKSS
jgi:hypothetical protein